MKTVKTSELIGPALDWAVAKCEGHAVCILTVEEQRARYIETAKEVGEEVDQFDEDVMSAFSAKLCVMSNDGYKRAPTHSEAMMIFNAGMPAFAYSTSWAQGGPIVEREKIEILPTLNPEYWSCRVAKKSRWHEGPTPLIAAMRCYVASKRGDTVEIPEGLE